MISENFRSGPEKNAGSVQSSRTTDTLLFAEWSRLPNKACFHRKLPKGQRCLLVPTIQISKTHCSSKRRKSSSLTSAIPGILEENRSVELTIVSTLSFKRSRITSGEASGSLEGRCKDTHVKIWHHVASSAIPPRKLWSLEEITGVQWPKGRKLTPTTKVQKQPTCGTVNELRPITATNLRTNWRLQQAVTMNRLFTHPVSFLTKRFFKVSSARPRFDRSGTKAFKFNTNKKCLWGEAAHHVRLWRWPTRDFQKRKSPNFLILKREIVLNSNLQRELGSQFFVSIHQKLSCNIDLESYGQFVITRLRQQ